MAKGRPRTRAPPTPVIDEPIPTDSTEHFSPLLWMPHSDHRVSLASREVRKFVLLNLKLKVSCVNLIIDCELLIQRRTLRL